MALCTDLLCEEIEGIQVPLDDLIALTFRHAGLDANNAIFDCHVSVSTNETAINVCKEPLSITLDLSV